MSHLKIGIDVGGTNTDAVVVDEDGQVIASTKSATTLDPSDGIAKALSEVITGVDKSKITQAMLGTTHPAMRSSKDAICRPLVFYVLQHLLLSQFVQERRGQKICMHP
jgi:N-acetylglucosamine kinase-like BadF-type ATPase